MGSDAMDEQEWTGCIDPTPMLAALRDQASERKLRLFAAACCRTVWHLLIDVRSRSAVEVAEGYADGLVSDEDREAAFDQAMQASRDVRGRPDSLSETTLSFRRRRDPEKVWQAAFIAAFSVGRGVGDIQAHLRGASLNLLDGVTRCGLLRCHFVGPLRLPSLDAPSWRVWGGGTVPKLARVIYDERRFNDLPILADALEEAGCTDAAILGHLRGPGPHYRGCWCVDAILANS